ncbi:MAG: ribosome recycling factor, partial [Pirellula sp.]
RNVRRDANKAIETAEKDKTISEDDRDSAKEDVQEMTKKYEDEVSELAKARESDVLEQ